jgi:hypothetical protein
MQKDRLASHWRERMVSSFELALERSQNCLNMAYERFKTYHAKNQFVVESEDQREEKVGSQPSELDGARY